METALDLSASRSSAASTPVRIKTDFVADASSISMNKAASSPVVSTTSSNQSPTSTMMSNSVFPPHFFRSLIPAAAFGGLQPHLTPPASSSFSANVGSIFENPALALASALASQGFLSPGSAPPYAPFFNSTMTAPMASPDDGDSTGSIATPPASTTGNTFFNASSNSTPEPNAFLPSASLALSTLHRRRRPTSYRRQNSIQNQPQSPADLQISDDQSTPDSGEQPPPLKKAIGTVPDEKKDELYWERRRKNNEAAKRSRDARRAKEEEIVVRAAYLEQENLKLKAQVAVLKNETAKLHFMLLNHVNSSA